MLQQTDAITATSPNLAARMKGVVPLFSTGSPTVCCRCSKGFVNGAFDLRRRPAAS